MTKINKIYAAVEKNNLSGLRALLDNDNASYHCPRKGNPLLAAVKAGHLDIVKYLLQREEKTFQNMPSKHKTALRAYTLFKPKTKEEIIRIQALKNEILKKHGFNLPAKHQAKGINQNSLIEAIKKENVAIINALTTSSLFICCNFNDTNGNTPFHYVDQIKDNKKRTEIATLLIKKGMDITIKNNKGIGVLHLNEYKKIQKEILAQQQRSVLSDIAAMIFFKKDINALIFSSIVATACLAASTMIPAMIFGTLVAGGYFAANLAYVNLNKLTSSERALEMLKHQMSDLTVEEKTAAEPMRLDLRCKEISRRITRVEQYLNENKGMISAEKKDAKQIAKLKQCTTKITTPAVTPALHKEKQKAVETANSRKRAEEVKKKAARR